MNKDDMRPGSARGTGLSRREFTASAAALGAITASGPLLSGIGVSHAAETPQRGGLLRVGFKTGGPNDTADPARSGHAGDHARMYQLYNGLTRTGPDLTAEPDLAESWDANDTVDDWIFKLRKGVEFHDGRPLRAEDVVYSLRRILDPATASPYRQVLSDIDPDALRAEDASTVRIKLTRPFADLPSALSSWHAGIIPDGFTDFDNAVGTGPFKLKTFRPGLVTSYVRNENYWRSGRPYIDELETSSVPDPIARVNALMSGELHLIEALDPKAAAALDQAPQAAVFRSKSGYHTHFIMRVDQRPFDNAEVRTALKLLVDRPKLLKLVYDDFGHLANDHPISPVYPDFCADIPQRTYDPDKAKHLLKQAGAEGLSVELHTSDALPGGVAAATLYSEMAAKGGVTIKVVRQPADGYWKAVWMQKPFCVGSWNIRPTAGEMLATAYKSDSNWNETNWKRPDFDQLLLQARATRDATKRAAMYCDLERMIRDEGGVIIPVFIDLLDGMTSKLKGLKPYPTGGLGGWRWEEVWFES